MNSYWQSTSINAELLVLICFIFAKLQAEKLAHSDLLMKDLWVENAKLMAALNATEQRVIQLENLLKFQMTTTPSSNSSSSSHHNNQSHQQNIYNMQQHPYSSPSSPHHGTPPNNPHHHNILLHFNNNNSNNSPNNAILAAPLSLPHQSSHFNIWSQDLKLVISKVRKKMAYSWTKVKHSFYRCVNVLSGSEIR